MFVHWSQHWVHGLVKILFLSITIKIVAVRWPDVSVTSSYCIASSLEIRMKTLRLVVLFVLDTSVSFIGLLYLGCSFRKPPVRALGIFDKIVLCTCLSSSVIMRIPWQHFSLLIGELILHHRGIHAMCCFFSQVNRMMVWSYFKHFQLCCLWQP